jgi:hypothetical protein
LEDEVAWEPETLVVLKFNTLRDNWGVGTEHNWSLDGTGEAERSPFSLDRPDVWLSAITFPGQDLATPPTEMVVHVTNESSVPYAVRDCHIWLPDGNGARHVFRRSSAVREWQCFGEDSTLPGGESCGFTVRCEPLSLTYAVIEVVLEPVVTDTSEGGQRSLWAHLRVKPEVFDISGGWVASDVNGRNSLTLEPYLKTLHRMHINTGHIADVPGYTDNAALYGRYPLRMFNKLVPFERFDNDEMLSRVHAVEFLGEPQYGGGRPVPPQEVWLELAPYQSTRLPTTVTHSEERIWRNYAGLSDYPHYDAYRVCAPAADAWSSYDRWGDQRIRWGAPLETIGDMTRSLRELNRPVPIAYWAQGAHHGWGRSRGRVRGSPTPEELRAQAWHALGQRITSLYWFNLSLKSLLKFPDLIEPITQVNRQIRLIDDMLVRGAAYEYRREEQAGAPQWDLSSVVSADSAVFVVNDLTYVPEMEEGVFRFTEREGEFRFRLPPWLANPAELFRIDAEGIHDVEHAIEQRWLVIRDRVCVAGVYVAARQPGCRAAVEREQADLLRMEESVGFDPGRNETDLATLRALVE